MIVGWGMRLHIDYYVIVDDEVAGMPGKRICTRPDYRPRSTPTSSRSAEAISRFEELDTYPGGAELSSPEIRGRCASWRRRVSWWAAGQRRRPARGRARRRVLPYVHLASTEISDLQAIAERSGKVTARDLPAAREVSLEELIRAAR